MQMDISEKGSKSMQESIEELYTKLSLLSSKSEDNKYKKIIELLLEQYNNSLNDYNYNVNFLRNRLQIWAEKNKNDCIICHGMILNDLFNNVKQNSVFENINSKNNNEKSDFVLELLKSNMNIASFFDLAKKELDLQGHNEEDIIIDITNLLNHMTTINDFMKSDIVVMSKLTSIASSLCKKINRFDYLTYAIFLPFISSIYKFGFTQDARNNAETFYLYLRKYNQNHLAFLIHSHLYSFQKSPYLTAINLTLSIKYAFDYNNFSDEYVFSIKTIYLRMLRDAQLYESLENFYENNILKSNNGRLILSSSLIYIHSLFCTNQEYALKLTIETLNTYRELLFDNEHEAITSWLVVIFNLIKFDRNNENEFTLYIEMFKIILGEEKYNHLYSYIFPTDETAKTLKNALPKTLDILFDSDIGYDINNYVMMAKELIKDAYIKESFEEILLCLFYLMSPEFVREIIKRNSRISMMHTKDQVLDPNIILENFENRLKKFVQSLNGNIAILIATSNEMYQVVFENHTKRSIHKSNLNTEDIHDWINKNSHLFEIKDSNEYELFESGTLSRTQEKAKKNIDDKIMIRLNIVDSAKNLIIFRSFNNSFFPHNFYKDTAGEYLSLKRPLSLNFSIDVSYANNLAISNNIGIWAPCDSGDPAINILYSRIEKFHHDNNINFDAMTSVLPHKKLTNDIAIVITHGNSNIDETNKVFFIQEDLQVELTNILEENKVIILFVCHSGKQSLSDYSYSIDSVIKNLLKNDTKAIIAPCWPLSIDIAYFYYKIFISKLYQNISIGEIHCQIMKEMSERNINPAVWGNLHYYGNPNIYLR